MGSLLLLWEIIWSTQTRQAFSLQCKNVSSSADITTIVTSFLTFSPFHHSVTSKFQDSVLIIKGLDEYLYYYWNDESGRVQIYKLLLTTGQQKTQPQGMLHHISELLHTAATRRSLSTSHIPHIFCVCGQTV